MERSRNIVTKTDDEGGSMGDGDMRGMDETRLGPISERTISLMSVFNRSPTSDPKVSFFLEPSNLWLA